MFFMKKERLKLKINFIKNIETFCNKNISNNYKNGNSEDGKKSIKTLNKQMHDCIIAIKKTINTQNKLFVSSKKERHDENVRKIFHFLGIILPFMVIFFSQKKAIILLLIVLIPVLIADYNNFALLTKNIPHSNIILQLFRKQELVKGKLSGLSWLLIGLLISICMFDKYIVSLSIIVLIVGDASAALIGKNFGRIKLCNKTLEGTISFIVTSIIASYIFINTFLKSNTVIKLLKIPETITIFNPTYIFVAIIISSIIELTAKNVSIDDNFAIPVTFCVTYEILKILINN